MKARDWRFAGGSRKVGTAVLALLLATPLAAQTPAVRALSLDQALRVAQENSEQIRIAEAAVTRATGGVYQARSAIFPQVNSSFSYQRTLATPFSSFSAPGPDSMATPAICQGPFVSNPALPLQQRVDSIGARLECPLSIGSLFSGFQNVGFGSENTYNLAFSVSQNVFTGGRIAGQRNAALASREAAEVGVQSARAQLALDVTQAYYDAQLAGRLLAIAEATLAQTDTTLQQTELGFGVGTQPEFEVLRARVARDNQRPNVIQQRANRELSVLRLKQLLDLPFADSLTLTTELEVQPLPPAATRGTDTLTLERAPVRQAAQSVALQEGQVRIARAERLPNLSLAMQYARQAFPSGAFPDFGDFQTNWTISAALQLPIFTGGRIRGDRMIAEATLNQAEAQLAQTRQLAALDTRNALAQLTAADASWEASAGTVEQAQRAYEIAQLRFREGISTQLELADVRLQLQQARANRARAARDLQVARTRVALLPDLPIGTASGVGTPANAGIPNGFGATQQTSTTVTGQQTIDQGAGTTGFGTNPQTGFPGSNP
jgi:outer membrane protein TolC